MKRKSQAQGGSGQIKKLQQRVQEFVEKAEKCGSGTIMTAPVAYPEPGVRVKSRRELRKEKRLSKKIRKKAFLERKFLGPQTAIGGGLEEPLKKPVIDGQGKVAGKKAAIEGKGKVAGKKTAIEGKGKVAGKKTAGDGQEKLLGKRPAGDGKEKILGKRPASEETRSEASKKRKKNKISREEARRKALLEDNEKEEKEIKRLEKSLRMNRRKNKSSLPQAFTQDGLDYILGVLEPGGDACGLYEEEEEANMADKLNKLSEKQLEEDDLEDSDQGEEMADDDDDLDDDVLDEEENEELDDDENEEMDDDVEDGDKSLSEKDHADDQDSEHSQEEETVGQDSEDGSDRSHNKDVFEPPVIDKTAPGLGNKYVPPQLRQTYDTVDAKRREELERLKKSVKGLMNRLSEPNMASISGQLEELYMANSRKDMNETTANIILNACITPAVMPDRLMMEHVLLISILHNTVGIEVGAHILESVVKQFHDLHGSTTESKECDNLIIFIGHLYNFHVIDSCLVFDILKLLVTTFTEKDIELILLLLKNVGFSLRKDDAVSLKELICDVQTKANAVDKNLQDQNRVRFMLETMLALKNNDMRKIPGYDPEPMEKLRKLQRSLAHSSMSGSDTRLRVSLENLLEADKIGRWWIVGSSWSGAPMIDQSSAKMPAVAGKLSTKIMDLARQQRMNTDIRRNIFCVLMTSEDYLDAFEKLLKLGLKHQQEREIVHVLIDCCLQEKSYNPFYAFLSSKFCEYDRRFQMTFQFTMWDKFKDLGSLSATTLSNLIHLLNHLIKKKSLPLSIFKVIEFSELDKIKVSFLRQILSKLLTEAEEDELAVIFGKVSDNAKLGTLREGLKLFISHFLLKNIRAQKSAEEADLLTQKAELAVKALEAKENRLRL